MENAPPPPEPKNPEPEFLQIRGIHRMLTNLSRSLSVLENGIYSLTRPDQPDTSQGLNFSKDEIEQLCRSIETFRPKLKYFFQVTGSEAYLENPTVMVLPDNPNPNSPIPIGIRLISGLTGCRHAFERMLIYDEKILKKEIEGTIAGQRYLARLATLSDIVDDMKFGSPDEVQAMIGALRGKIAHPLNVVQNPSPPLPLKPRKPLPLPEKNKQPPPPKASTESKKSAPTPIKIVSRPETPKGPIAIPIKPPQKEDDKAPPEPKKGRKAEADRESLPDSMEKPVAFQLIESFVPLAPCLQIDKQYHSYYPGCDEEDLYRVDETKTGIEICQKFRENLCMEKDEAIVGFRRGSAWKILMVREKALRPKKTKEED
jgi:hypothetical protein